MQSKKIAPLTTVEDAYNFALHRLDVRDYGQREMVVKLQERGCPSDIIKQVIDKLLLYKLINEEKYAQRVYNYWLSKKYYGRSHLRLTLTKKQVQPELVNEILAQFTEDNELERAKSFTYSNFPKYKRKYGQEMVKAKAALGRALATRGFSNGIISKILACLDT